MKASKENEKTSLAYLKKVLKPGKKVYTILRHVSSSGMSRQISVAIATKDGITDIDWHVANVCGYSRNPQNGALRVSGCGMDMGFAVVYDLSRTIFPKGFKLAKGQHGRNGDKSGYDNDGGYALKQVWL